MVNLTLDTLHLVYEMKRKTKSVWYSSTWGLIFLLYYRLIRTLFAHVEATPKIIICIHMQEGSSRLWVYLVNSNLSFPSFRYHRWKGLFV